MIGGLSGIEGLPMSIHRSVAALLLALGISVVTVTHAETVLVTGSNQGIGLEFAKEYAERGWKVIATHRHSSTPEELAKLKEQYPKLVRVELMDVTDDAQIKALAAKLKDEPIDIIINNAALIRTARIDDRAGNANQLFGTLDYKLFDDFMHTNVTGPLKIAEAFIGNVKASQQKKFITISSAAGMVSVPPRSADHYWYRISKAAVNSAMRLLSVQFQNDGVLVAMFHPGGVRTESFKELNMPGLVPTEEAVGKMIKTIDGLTMKDTGRFLQNDGKDLPW
jgi:NAD(P)-dependent dehydrogenase (short-subunit alcohol dehydrogenase family)